MAKKKIRVPKESQSFIPGTDEERIPAIERAASAYADFRDQRIEAGEQEVKLKKKLIDVMKEYSLETYKFDGFMVILTHVDEDEIKVKKLRAAKD
jgi:folate-dependent phosphoribosylglycinamide formyltransferase PurN